jgi:Fe-S oxidoreductase
MKYQEILHRCFRCGYCTVTSDYSQFNCPSYLKFGFDTYTPGGRMWLIRAWLKEEIENSPRFQEILFSCATCGSCVEHCAFVFKKDLVNIFIAAREEMIERGRIPLNVRDYLKGIHTHGNPYKAPIEEREAWAKGIPIRPYDDQEYLFYLGCVGAYDIRGKKMAQSVATLLSSLGVSLGFLGKREMCDGNEVRALGESGLFEFLAKKNIALFKERGVKKIITLDPHAFNAFERDYRELGGDFEVYHYTQILAPLMTSGNQTEDRVEARVTFHDPCYLGRYNGEYEAPRRILKAVPGLELVEMSQNRENAFCCGGGGGNFFTDILGGGKDSPANIRVRQAFETGAQVLAVACPQCAGMLDNAVKAEGLEEEVQVRDIAEIVLDIEKEGGRR